MKTFNFVVSVALNFTSDCLPVFVILSGLRIFSK